MDRTDLIIAILVILAGLALGWFVAAYPVVAEFDAQQGEGKR